jgi:hypothetical protein
MRGTWQDVWPGGHGAEAEQFFHRLRHCVLWSRDDFFHGFRERLHVLTELAARPNGLRPGGERPR